MVDIKQSFTFQVLYYWGKFLGINPLTLSNKNEFGFSYFSLFYGCILNIFYCYLFYRALIERDRLLTQGETPIAIIVNYIVIGCYFFENSLTWFVFAIYQTRVKCFVKSIMKTEKTLKKLGMPDNFEKYLSKFGIKLAVHNVVYVISLTLCTKSLMAEPSYDGITWFSFNLPKIVSFNVVLLFIGCLVFVQQKICQLNERVKGLMQNYYLIASRVYETPSPGLIWNTSSPAHFANRINIIAQLHRELRNIIRRIEEHFAPFILFTLVNSGMCLTASGYVICQSFRERNQVTGMELAIHIGGFNHWFIYPLMSLIEIATISGSTSAKANNTGNIIHGMLNNCNTYIDTRETAELNTLLLDLLKNRVSISVFGLIDLNDYFLHRTFAAAITYFTIMLQFDS